MSLEDIFYTIVFGTFVILCGITVIELVLAG